MAAARRLVPSRSRLRSRPHAPHVSSRTADGADDGDDDAVGWSSCAFEKWSPSSLTRASALDHVAAVAAAAVGWWRCRVGGGDDGWQWASERATRSARSSV